LDHVASLWQDLQHHAALSIGRARPEHAYMKAMAVGIVLNRLRLPNAAMPLLGDPSKRPNRTACKYQINRHRKDEQNQRIKSKKSQASPGSAALRGSSTPVIFLQPKTDRPSQASSINRAVSLPLARLLRSRCHFHSSVFFFILCFEECAVALFSVSVLFCLALLVLIPALLNCSSAVALP
jgi:hypothetical protein